MGSHKSQLIDLAKPKYYPGKWKFSQITRCNEWNTIIISLHTRETICDRRFDLVGAVVKNPRIPPPHPGLEFLMEDLETLAIATPEFSGVKRLPMYPPRISSRLVLFAHVIPVSPHVVLLDDVLLQLARCKGNVAVIILMHVF